MFTVTSKKYTTIEYREPITSDTNGFNKSSLELSSSLQHDIFHCATKNKIALHMSIQSRFLLEYSDDFN